MLRSGKSGIVRCLQALLPDPWLAVGVDRVRGVAASQALVVHEGVEYVGS